MKEERCSGRIGLQTLALGIATAMAAAIPVSAATLYVSPTSPSPSPPYATAATAAHNLQEAVDVARDRDTVLVGPGQYDLTNPVTLTKAIALRSTMGAGQTFLNSQGDTWCLWISNSRAVADGFTLQNPSGSAQPSARGAYLAGGTVQNCNFTNFLLTATGTSVAMTGGVLSNSTVIYGCCIGGSAVDCRDGGLITDCQVLGLGRRIGAYAIGVNLVDSQLRNSVIWGVEGVPEAEDGPAVNALSSTIVACSIVHNSNDGPGGGAYLDSCLMDRCFVAYNDCASEGTPGIGGGGVFEINSIILNSLIVSNSVGNGTADSPQDSAAVSICGAGRWSTAR